MRLMVLAQVKATDDSAKGILPTTEAMEAMGCDSVRFTHNLLRPIP
jgi:hypothetical protein